MKLTSEHVKKINEILNAGLEMKEILRRTSPNHNLDVDSEKRYTNNLKILDRANRFLSGEVLPKQTTTPNNQEVLESSGQQKIAPITEISIDFEEFQKRAEKIMFVVSSASNKNILKKAGVSTLNVIETGGPLTIEDAMTLKPDLPEQARLGIAKRIDSFWQQISKRVTQVTPIKLVLLLDASEKNDNLVGNHVNTFEEKLSLPVIAKFVPDLKELNWKQIGSIIS